MYSFVEKERRALLAAFAAAILLAGLAACGGSPSSGEQEHATEEALAATETGSDTRRAAAVDTPDTAGQWVRTDTAGALGDTLPLAEGVSYETYHNDAFGYSVRYPAQVLNPASEIGDGNGRTFEAPDGSASMLVYATGGATAQNLQQRYQEQNANPDLNVTYKTRGEDWYVISGYRGDHIFYERTALEGDGTLKTIRLFYDRARKRYFDPIVREVAFSM